MKGKTREVLTVDGWVGGGDELFLCAIQVAIIFSMLSAISSFALYLLFSVSAVEIKSTLGGGADCWVLIHSFLYLFPAI